MYEQQRDEDWTVVRRGRRGRPAAEAQPRCHPRGKPPHWRGDNQSYNQGYSLRGYVAASGGSRGRENGYNRPQQSYRSAVRGKQRNSWDNSGDRGPWVSYVAASGSSQHRRRGYNGPHGPQQRSTAGQDGQVGGARRVNWLDSRVGDGATARAFNAGRRRRRPPSRPQQRQNNNNNNNNTQPTQQVQSNDPDFKIKTKYLHNIIRMTHHLKNVTQSAPPTIQRMTDVLSTMIQPASPSESVKTLIQGNAKNWEYNTLLILRDHYEDSVIAEIMKIAVCDTLEWREPFRVAAKWAKRTLGRRLTEDTLMQVEASLVQMVEEQEFQETLDSMNSQLGEDGSFGSTHTVSSLEVDHTTTRDHGGDGRPALETQANGGRSPCCPLSPSETCTAPPVSPAVLLPPPSFSSTERPRVRRTLGPRFQDTTEMVHMTTRVQRGVGQPALETQVHGGLSPCCLLSSSEALTPLPVSPAVLPPPSSPSTERLTGRRALCPRVQDSGNPVTVSRQLQLEEVLPPRTPTSTPTRRPTRHGSTSRKMQDWSLHIRRRVVILGDSNLGRFPSFRQKDLQVDSYPGANFRHASSLLYRATYSTQPEKIVLAFGLNHRNQRAHATAVKQLQLALRMAKQSFPDAEVIIPVINFDSALPIQERHTLNALNKYIVERCSFITTLPARAFSTEEDKVHWSRETAEDMLSHFIEGLY